MRLEIGLVMGALVAASCGPTEPVGPTLEELAAEKCPRVHLDRLAGDWIIATGNPKTRMRLIETDSGYTAWFVGGFYAKLELEGEKRRDDVQLTELPRGARAGHIAKGDTQRMRMYVKPKLESCSVEVFAGTVDADGKEAVEIRGKEYLEFPDQGVVFTYRPPDETLFLGKAAKSWKAAKAEIEEFGAAKPDQETGDSLAVAAWSDPAADGDEACTYDMDLYYDDQPLADGQGLAAGEMKEGRRQWLHDWPTPSGGNHNLEMYRYRTCAGGERALIAVSAIEAIIF